MSTTHHSPLTGPAPLAALRSRLRRLGRRRAAVRYGTAAATFGIVVLLALAATFAGDFLGRLDWPQRAVLILAAAFAAGWAAYRFVRPWLGVRETETDLALLVERKHGLDGDLVAALQFQSEEAARWGSPQLERAVIGYVDEASRELPVSEGFSWTPLPGRAAAFAALLAAAAVAAVLFPAYAGAFFERLFLAKTAYPTRTILTTVTVNGTELDLGSDDPLRVAAGTPLAFAVSADGERPETGVVRLEGDSGSSTDLTLAVETPESREPREGSRGVATPRLPSAPNGPQGRYAAKLESLSEPATFTVVLGDARTSPRRVEVVPRPAVTLELSPTPPAYAASASPAPPAPGVRTAFVLEGSDVAVTVRGSKPLAKVSLAVDGKDHPLTASSDRKVWRLAPKGTPLAAVAKPLSFTVSAADDDGLSPAEAVTGSVRLRADRPPRVAAASVVRSVLPTASPTVTYGATDDFGVAAVRAVVAVRKSDGTTAERIVPLPNREDEPGVVRGRFPLELGPLGVAKGDQVVVTVEAEDRRGDGPGRVAKAEPLTFEVTDREGLLAALLQADEEGAERLDAIIRRELGIGGER